jgi:hypothetical protein
VLRRERQVKKATLNCDGGFDDLTLFVGAVPCPD